MRDDLDISPRVVDGEPVYFVGDSIKNEYHQLDEVQYEIFRRLDGQTSLATLVTALDEEFDLEVDEETLAEFIGMLQELNLLDLAADSRLDLERGREISQRVKKQLDQTGVVFALRVAVPSVDHRPPAAGERRQRHREAVHFDQALRALGQGDIQASARRLRQVVELEPRNQRARYLLHLLLEEHLGKSRGKDSIWWWRFPIADPDRFLSTLDRWFGRFLFSKLFRWLWIAMVSTAIVLVLFNLENLNRDLTVFFSFRWLAEDPQLLILVWSVGPLIIFGHETSHGLACRHYGGRVREMGVLFAYLQPSAFCDIGATYLFQDKWQRFTVAMAGTYWHAVIWSLFVFIYHVTSTSSAIGWLAMMSVPMLGISVILGFSPAIRGDGYIALTELLEYPNLRPDAFNYLALQGQRLLLGSAVEIPEELQAKRRLLLWYALPSVAATAFVMISVMLRIAGYLVENFHSLGVLVYATMLILYSAGPLTRATRAAWRNRAWLWAQPRLRKVSLAAVALLALGLATPWPLRIEAPFEVKLQGEWVRAPFATTIDHVLVENGARVEAGAALVQLNTDATLAAEQRSWAALAMAEADLHQLLAGARGEEIAVQEAAVRAAWAELHSWRRQVDRLSRVAAGGSAVMEQLDGARASMAAAETSYRTAKKALEGAQAGAQDKEILAQESRVEMLRAQWESDRARLDATLLRAPIAGRVRIRVGDSASSLHLAKVGEGDAVAYVRADRPPQLEARVPINSPVNVIRPGATAHAKLLGWPHLLLIGEATHVQSALGASSEDQAGTEERAFVPVRVELRETFDELDAVPEGLTGSLRISAGWYPVAMHLYLRAARLVRIDLNRLLS